MWTNGISGRRSRTPELHHGLAGWIRSRRDSSRLCVGRKLYYRSLAGRW